MARKEHPMVTSTRQKVRRCAGYYLKLSEVAGVSESWVKKFAIGKITNPTINNLYSVNDACNVILRKYIAVDSE